jgi:unsaturated rhamnogalacturonyl hydrolase
MKKRLYPAILFIALLTQPLSVLAQNLEWDVGLGSKRSLINAQGVAAGVQGAPTVLYLAGLMGESDSSDRVRTLLNTYSQMEAQDRPINLLAIALANPDLDSLVFPPDGNAYAENPVSNALWRWIGVHAPDLVVIADQDQSGLASALQGEAVADTGSIPVQLLSDRTASVNFLSELPGLEQSPASLEVERRLSRSPAELAQQLAETYGYDFSSPVYVPGMSLIGRMRLGYMEEVGQLIQGHLSQGAIEVSNASLMAGHLVFAEYAERTGDDNALRLTISAADLAFDEQGNAREAMPFHSEMSDSVFMATPLLVKAGKLTGQSKYFDMAVSHVEYMQSLLLRDDGLYRHSPLADVAWSRGNGFPALGLALSLSDLPESHPGYSKIMASFVEHLETLRPFQDIDGMWREVIDYPGSFAELSATAMIGIAIKRGIDRGWLSREVYQPILNLAWNAVLVRTSLTGEFIDVCTSTGKMQSLDAYLDRLAIFGRDDRAGGMVMLFANEMAGNM